MKTNNKNKFLLLFFLIVGSTGCTKLDLAPTDRYTELNFWESAENLNNALNNVYNRIYNSSYFFYNEALSDNAYTRQSSGSGSPNIIVSGSFTPTLDRFQNEWKFYYTGIKAANIFLENVDKNEDMSSEKIEQLKAEVRFVRAFHHFKLMNWWGDIPMLQSDITPDEAKTIARTPRSEVVKFVSDELNSIKDILPKKEEYGTEEKGRITKGAALAFRARVLLYEGNRMEEVVRICEELMENQSENGEYNLAGSYGEIFSPDNEYGEESIFELGYVPSYRTWNHHIDFVPLSGGARSNNLAPTQELVDSYVMLNGRKMDDPQSGYDKSNPFLNRDPRLDLTIVRQGSQWENRDGSEHTIYIEPGSDPDPSAKDEYKSSGQGTASGYYLRKYYDPTSPANFESGLNIILMRYAEVLLMYAEAKEALGEFDGKIWNKTIRPLRERAGFKDSEALEFPSGASNIKEIIRNERRSEFAFEDLRIDDIRRWETAEEVLNGWAHGARYGDRSVDDGYLRVQMRSFEVPKHYLWPIPESEISKNNNLTQNPGYN